MSDPAFRFVDPMTGKTITGKVGKSSWLSPTWKWGILVNDAGEVILFRTQKHAVIYARYRWGTSCNFVLVRYCAKGSKS